ncbi:hypothetical protein D3C84_936570 [compost metagenome]
MPAIFFFLASIVGPLAAKILTSLGIGMVSYVGINLLLAQVKSYILSSFSGAPVDVLSILGMLKVDVSINIILAAVTARAVISGMNRSTGTRKQLGGV